MDEATIRHIEMEGADALLDAGVSVPLKSFCLPFRKKPVEIRVTMRRPCLDGQIRIAKIYLSMGVTSQQMWEFTKEQEMSFLVDNGSKIAKMIALMVCRGDLRRCILLRIMTWAVRHWMSNDHLLGAMKRFVSLMGTDPFIPIIRSAERTNPMKPRMSQRKKGS